MATEKRPDIITCDLCGGEVASRPMQARVIVRSSVPHFRNGTRVEHLIESGSHKEIDLCETCARGTGVWSLLYPEQKPAPVVVET